MKLPMNTAIENLVKHFLNNRSSGHAVQSKPAHHKVVCKPSYRKVKADYVGLTLCISDTQALGL